MKPGKGQEGRLRDILAEKKNLERILDNLTEGIIAHDPERRILFFNRAAERITGYPREEVLGRDCRAAFGGPLCGTKCFADVVPPAAWQDMRFPVNILTRSGEPRRLELAVTKMIDQDGAFAGVLASFHDLTDLIALRIQLGELDSFNGIVARDPEMMHVFRQIRDLTPNHYPVLISGETGTGKELVAAAIHEESLRAGAPFVPINCGAIPEGILESELFGHVKGAFSGAIRDKRGRFELARGGTVFLDEVADLPRAVQVKLLRVLQEGTFERVGGEETVSADVRVISATNRDLKQEVRAGRFREDLYYRLNVVPLHLPPLRKRRNDIPLLIEHFLRQGAGEGQKPAGLSREALAAMMDYPWPGNVRELQSAVRFAGVRSQGRIIRPQHLPLELQTWKKKRSSRGPSRKLDQERVTAALSQTGGNRAQAARMLGVGRATLYRFLADHPHVS